MATTRTVDFLPPIFQTSTNKQFLAATLDQLVQEPQFKKTQGFIGRSVGPGVNPNDYYVIEPTATRANYQLEPGVISLVPDTNTISDAITYPGITDAIGRQGGATDNSARLYTSEYYSWDPFINFDKFSNYSQYYWVPAGPLAVDVSATTIPVTVSTSAASTTAAAPASSGLRFVYSERTSVHLDAIHFVACNFSIRCRHGDEAKATFLARITVNRHKAV